MKRLLRRTIWQALAILGLAGVAAALTAKLHPRVPAWYRVENVADEIFRLSVAELRERYQPDQLLWIDARSSEQYQAGHVDGARSLNEENWAEQLWRMHSELENLNGLAIVVYCDGKACQRSARVAGRLRSEMGLEPVWILRGDWQDW